MNCRHVHKHCSSVFIVKKFFTHRESVLSYIIWTQIASSQLEVWVVGCTDTFSGVDAECCPREGEELHLTYGSLSS